MHRNVGPAAARSVGLRLLRSWARGRDVVVGLTDSDAAPSAEWLEAMLAAQQERPCKSASRSHELILLRN